MTSKSQTTIESATPVEREALSIAEWCEANTISKAFFYKLPECDRPAVLELGRRRLITREASADWRKRMTKRQGTEAA